MSQLDREDKAKELLKEAGYGEGGKPPEHRDRYNTNDNTKGRDRDRRHVKASARP